MDKPRTKILILIDNFLIGGRETFIKSYLSALSDKQEYSFGLMANRINESVLGSSFDYVHAMDKESPLLNDWLSEGHLCIEEFKPDIVWVHHYQLLTAWLLSCYYQIPLMCTLHGSIQNQGKFKRIQDQLGLACILKYPSSISTVSGEIKDQLMEIDGDRNSSLLVNAIRIKEHNQRNLNEKKSQKNVKQNKSYAFVLLTRQQKLDHLRVGIKLFCKLKKHFPGSRLTIHTGRNINERGGSSKQLISIVGRKWTLKTPAFLFNINSIEVKPLVDDVTSVLEKADVVLGMGRVMIEAIAYRKVALLVGYDHYVGVINDNNFMSLQHNNFSGRESIQQAEESIVKNIDQFMLNQNSLERMFDEVDVENQVSNLESEINDILKNKKTYIINVDTNVDQEVKALINKAKQLKEITIDDDLIKLKSSLIDYLAKIKSS